MGAPGSLQGSAVVDIESVVRELREGEIVQFHIRGVRQVQPGIAVTKKGGMLRIGSGDHNGLSRFPSQIREMKSPAIRARREKNAAAGFCRGDCGPEASGGVHRDISPVKANRDAENRDDGNEYSIHW